MNSKETSLELSFTLPFFNYTDSQFFEEERKKVFSESWIFVGHTSQVNKIGDFFTFEVAGEPIIVTHGNDGKLRAFYNICPHRGTKVEQKEKGNKKILQCAYHGRTFKLDGLVHRAPNFGKNEQGDRSCLRSIQLDVQRSMIFVNLAPNAPALADEYQEYLNELQRYPFLDSLQLVKENRRLIEANWKAVVDNFLECDHCSIAHPAFSKTFDMSKYTLVPSDKFSYQCSNVKGEDENLSVRFYWVWPNMMLSVYPGTGNMTTTQLIPLEAEKTMAVYRYYFMDVHITKEEEEMIKFVDQVREEDFDLVELLQTGLRSQAFDKGIYSPTEHAMQHFHKMIGNAMEGSGIP
ncbi:Phenylpropionate dioxygenase, large terminal subunit [Bacillus sp. OK838]|nr:Phenylpropionate dioxygenase, large terminal subunit [Bacillus sp. OK838]